MTDQQRYAVADQAVRNVRRSRRLRQQYGIGWLSLIIALAPAIIELIERILAILREREAVAGKFESGRLASYQMVASDHDDPELVYLVEAAELEVVGS